MDHTEEYIKMCEKAVKIQELWEPEEGDFIFNTSANNGKGHLFVNYKYQPCDDKPDWVLVFGAEEKKKHSFDVFLPHQDQLQKMVFKGTVSPLIMFDTFLKEIWDAGLEFKSPEQLWLAFVMREKFGTQWNKKKKDWEVIA